MQGEWETEIWIEFNRKVAFFFTFLCRLLPVFKAIQYGAVCYFTNPVVVDIGLNTSIRSTLLLYCTMSCETDW